MKHKCLHIIKIAFGIATVLFLGGCSSDDSTHEPLETPMRELHFMLGSYNYQDVTPETSRRALPEGYVLYSELTPKIPLDGASLRCFMTKDTEVKFNGNVTYNSGAWVSKIPLDEGTYYVYGLMPGSEAGKVKLTPITSNFANGATMEIQGLNPVTSSDVCTIVGVKGSTTAAGFANVDIKQGAFAYDAQNDGTFIYLLIDHLYAALQLNMNISPEYNALRTIKLTKLTLKSNSVTKTYKVTATMTPSETNTLGVTYDDTTQDGKEIELYNGKGKGENSQDIEQELEVDDYLQFLACTLPLSTNTQFEMETTYNVYDRKGNLIRKNCTAKNVLNLPTGGLTRGQKYTFNLTVNPTYLYVLSDPDLDNPTITVN